MKIRKDGGLVVPFDIDKIKQAVFKALSGTGLPSESLSAKVAEDVVRMLGTDKEIVDIKEVQDCVEKALMRRDLGDASKAYILYRDMRNAARERLHVMYPGKSKPSVTDRSLLLFQSDSKGETSKWDRTRIIERLMTTFDMPNYKAAAIAKEVEDRVIASGITTVTSSLIRELVNNILEANGCAGRLQDMTMYQVPREFIASLLKSKSNENSNIVANNPEAVNLTLAEYMLKQYALDAVFSDEVKAAHISGMIYVHDLGYPHRVYCSSHSIEYIKRYGLRKLNNLNTESNPAKSASVLTGHLNTFLASMQANYAGALGLGYINILYAPMLIGMTKKELHQVAQELVFNGSQNAFSRGGQSLHPDELIWVKRNGKYQSVKIGKFVDALIEAHPESVRHTDEYEVYNMETENIQAISFEKAGGNVLDKPIMYVARMPHKGKMYRVHTSNGIVNITGDHSLFTFNGKGDIRPTKTKDLKKGDFVVIPHKVNLEGRQTHVNILDYLPEDWLAVHGASKVFEQIQAKGKPSKVLLEAGATRYIMKDAKKSDKVRASLAGMFVPLADCELGLKGDSPAHVQAKLALTPELGYVAGMFCAEGHNANRKVVISNTSPELLYKVAANLDRMQYSWYRYNHGMEHGMTTDQVEINGVLGAFLQKSCTDGRRKVVPDWVFTAPDCCVEAFLEGFYDGEGSNRKNKPDEWSVSNTSTRVVAGISLLLLSRGRETHIYESKPANSAWNACYEVRESAERKVNPFTEYTTVNGYETYKNHINAETREAVDWLIGSDLSVSIIKNIEEYEYEGYVYDISVPGTEAFLGGIGNVFFKNTLFLDFNIHTGVPSYLRDVPAIGPGGKYMFRKDDGTVIPLKEDVCVSDADNEWLLYYDGEDGNPVQVLSEEDGKQTFGSNVGGKVLTYGDFEKEAQQFAHALLDVWCEGDARGRVFEFPKCDFHVNKDTFETEGQLDVLKHACRVAAINGSPYFVFDRDSVSIASCCRLRVQITDMSLLRHPERLRTCGAQNVTINIPQAAYRAAKNGHKDYDGICAEIDKAMDLAVKAHLQKKASIESMMKGPGDVLWQLGQPSCDGKPYLDMNDATYIIGLIGVNDAVQYLTGKQMHESDETFDLALRITSHMFLRTKEYTKQYGLQFKLEESPAESAARRLARSDLQRFREDALQVYKGGDEEHAYYTNSIHLVANADVDCIERIDKQSMFNSLIEAGAITHLFTGDKANDPGAIEALVTQVYLRTQCAQLTVSPEFTYCNTCGHKSAGIKDKCDRCGSTNVVGETRIVGYFSKVPSWNLSKQAELKDRQRGNYAVQAMEDLK